MERDREGEQKERSCKDGSSFRELQNLGRLSSRRWSPHKLVARLVGKKGILRLKLEECETRMEGDGRFWGGEIVDVAVGGPF